MQNMTSSTKQLYLFLTARSGNRRNTIHISCQGDMDSSGYLLAADRDGQQFYELMGEQIDPPSAAASSPKRDLSLCTHSICSGVSLRRRNIR